MDVPPGQLGDLVRLLLVVLTAMGAGLAAFQKILRDNSTAQREHEAARADRNERLGDKFGLSLTQACGSLEAAVETLKAEVTELRHGQADV